MKNVLQIVDYAAPYKGNFILSIEELWVKLYRNGDRLIYLFPENTRDKKWVFDLTDNGRKVHYIGSSFFSKRIRIKNLSALFRIIRIERIDIIHTHFVFYNYSLLFLKLFLPRKIKIIGHFHNHFSPPVNSYRRFKICIVDMLYDQIIGVSRSVAESVIKSGISKLKVSFIPNAINFDRLDRFETIDLKEGNQHRKVVLIFGWPFLRKGLDVAISAVKEVRACQMDVILVIALPGAKDQIINMITEFCYEFPSWLKILDAREDVASYYNAADIFLSAGREEGLNYSVVEAAYCNCSIIVSAIPGNPQDIPFTVKYEVENVMQLRDSIIEILGKTKSEINQINLIQKEYVRKEYDLNNWAESVVNQYQFFT